MGTSRCAFFKGSVTSIFQQQKEDAIHELIRKAEVFQAVQDTEEFEKAVMERECEQCTGFGKGVAVAHANYEGIDSIIMGLGISQEGIDYKSFDGKTVRLLFLIASPESMQEEYLLVLSALVKLLRQDSFRNELISTPSLRDAREYLNTRFCSQLERETAFTHKR